MDKRDIKIFVKCDYYGAENYIRIGSYNKNKERNNGKYFCLKCLRERESKMYMEKYGVNNVFKNKEIYRKALKTRLSNLENEHTPSSKNQKHIVELYNGILNYQIDSYFVDGLLENNVFLNMMEAGIICQCE